MWQKIITFFKECLDAMEDAAEWTVDFVNGDVGPFDD